MGVFVMHYTPFNRSAVFDPDMLKELGETFDKAWAAIASNFTGSSREGARVRLATLILEFGADGDSSALEVGCRAIGAMHLPLAA
jgi:hypothetical protein